MGKSGKVYLVGAGPGNPDLLTVKAKALIEGAQVVVYDRLIGREIIGLLPETACKINVGKEAGHHPVPQEEINRILVEEALKGHDVVRLKGGDSFVFGRGGEELEELIRAGIAFEVVPGITSAIAAAAYAGIPVTHRDYASSLHIITGHRKKDGKLDLDYGSLVRLKGTLIFLMSLAALDQLIEGLLEAGMSPDMDCALIENGTRPYQRKVLGTLANIESLAAAQTVVSPALFIVGRVCSLADQFDWFGRLPLKGRRILAVQHQKTGRRLAEALGRLGAEVRLLPVMQTRPLAFDLPDLTPYTTLVFTSANGVDAYFQQLLAAGQDCRLLAGKKLAAVGSQTAEALAKYGLRPDFVPSFFQGEALAREMIGENRLTPADRLLLLQAKEVSPGLGQALDEGGIPYDSLAVYETFYNHRDFPGDLAGYDWITFTAASCVEGLARCAAEAASTAAAEAADAPIAVATAATPALRPDFSGLPALCIGPTTAEKARQLGMKVTLPPQATIDSMIDTLLSIYAM